MAKVANKPEINKQKLTWGQFIDPENPAKGKYYPLHDGQIAVYNSDARFTAAIAGTGGGKTVLGPLWVAKQIDRVSQLNRPILGLVVAPTYKVLQRATVPTLIETFKGTTIEGEWKDQKNLYVLPDGGKIWCQGADNPGGIEGGQFDFVWGDEAGQFKYAVWVAIQGRTGQKQSPVLFTTTPYGKNWLFSEFYKKYLAGDKNYFVKQWSSIANPTYAKDEYDRAKKELAGSLGAMRYDGQFMQMEGLVYPNFAECLVALERVELTNLLLDPRSRFYGGLDFGWNDPFCGLCGCLDHNDILWVWYERYKSRTTIEEHAENLPKFEYKTIRWYSEHQPEAIVKLRKGGHKVLKANKNILAGINAVNSRILTGRLKILTNKCPALVAEGETYCYPEDEESTGGDKPIGGFDHALDALRYMVSGIDIKKPA